MKALKVMIMGFQITHCSGFSLDELKWISQIDVFQRTNMKLISTRALQ